MNKDKTKKLEITEFCLGAKAYFEKRKENIFRKSLEQMLHIKKEHDEAVSDFIMIFGDGYNFHRVFYCWEFFDKLVYHVSTGIPIELTNEQRRMGLTGLNMAQLAFNHWLKSLD